MAQLFQYRLLPKESEWTYHSDAFTALCIATLVVAAVMDPLDVRQQKNGYGHN